MECSRGRPRPGRCCRRLNRRQSDERRVPRTFETPTWRSRILTITAFAAAGALTVTGFPPETRAPSISLHPLLEHAAVRAHTSRAFIGEPPPPARLANVVRHMLRAVQLLRTSLRSSRPRSQSAVVPVASTTLCEKAHSVSLHAPGRRTLVHRTLAHHASSGVQVAFRQCASRRAAIYICRWDRAHASCADASPRFPERMAGMP